jgi:hypothetical protein
MTVSAGQSWLSLTNRTSVISPQPHGFDDSALRVPNDARQGDTHPDGEFNDYQF